MGLMELKDHGLKIFNIDPSSIYINEDVSQLTFTDIQYIGRDQKETKLVIKTHSPYAGRHGLMKEREAWESQSRDMHSIGVVILEVIVGTELVIMAKNEDYMAKLLNDLEMYLDEETMALLRYLIQDDGHVDIRAFVENKLSDQSQLI